MMTRNNRSLITDHSLTRVKKDFSIVFREEWNNLCIMAPRGGGKTVLAMQVMFKKFLLNKDKPRCKCGFFGPTECSVKTIVAPIIMSFSEEISKKCRGITVTFNKTTGETSVDFGRGDVRKMYVGSYEQGERLRGKHFDFLVLDEMSLCPDDLFLQVIRPIMIHNGTKAKMLIIGTPKPVTGDLFIRLFEKGLPENKKSQWHLLKKMADNKAEYIDVDALKWKSILYKASTSNLLDPVALEAERAGMPKEMYEMEYECDYTVQVGEGFLFANELANITGNINDDVNIDVTYPVLAAWDIGFTCPTAVWIYQIIGNERHYIDYYECSKKHISFHLSEMKKKPYDIWLHIVPHDTIQERVSAKDTAYKTFANGGHNVHLLPCTTDRTRDLECAAESIRRCHFNKTRCKQGLDHLRRYELKKEKHTGFVVLQPTSASIKHADAADAFRYSWQAGDPIGGKRNVLKVQYNCDKQFYDRLYQ